MKTELVENTPKILKAIELILANPVSIKSETNSLVQKYKNCYPNKTQSELRKTIAKKIISNYSYYAAFAGGSTALAGVVPGLGTAVALTGATADAALCMKFQIEMTMALATLYNHDILLEEEKRLCMIIAGLGAISEAAKTGAKEVGTKSFTKLVQENLKGSLLIAVKKIFKMIGLTFTRKALEKTIPFGVGVLIGFGANKVLSKYVGSKAIEFFEHEND